MEKKQIVHFPDGHHSCWAVCGCFFPELTNRRDKVTCKRCKATKRFREVR